MADTAQQYFKLREIKVLISLLTCIDNPLQDIPMASVLLSYFGGFTEDELCKIRISGKKYSQKFLIRQMGSIAAVSYTHLDKLVAFAKENAIDLTVIGICLLYTSMSWGWR